MKTMQFSQFSRFSQFSMDGAGLSADDLKLAVGGCHTTPAAAKVPSALKVAAALSALGKSSDAPAVLAKTAKPAKPAADAVADGLDVTGLMPNFY
jgi:hypothetical protein